MTQRSFSERLRSGEILVADGATGTNYQDAGLEIGVPPEEWVFDAPEQVHNLHRAFVEAGADVILTCSFGGTRLRLRDSKYADQAPALNRRAAELARAAAGEHTLVAGSIGPTGLLFEPFGELTHAEAVANFAEQAAALAAGGADLLVIETIFALEEALAAIEGARQVCALPLVCSFSYDRGTRTMMGVSPAQMAAAITPLGVAALGANCGLTLEAMEQVVTELVGQDLGLPIWAKPNAGLPTGMPPRYNTTPEDLAAYAARYIAAGAQIVGGCCGTTPAHIAVIARTVASMKIEDRG